MVRDPGRPLFDAAALGETARVRELLASGANPSVGLQQRPERFPEAALSPLSVAVEHGHMEIVEMLVAAGASVPAHDEQQSLIARATSVSMVQYLLACGASPTSPTLFSFTPVDAIASEEQMSVADRVIALRLLVQHGADLAAPRNTISLLWRAANNGDVDAVDAALQAGADPCTDPSALSGAIFGSHPGQREYDTPDSINRTIDLLVAAGCDVHERDERGWQPLHGALMEYSHGAGFMSSDGCNGPAAEALIRHGASIDIAFDRAGCRFPTGSGPLHVAAAQGDPYAVRVLLAAGASPSARAENGATPADLARAAAESDGWRPEGAPECLRLLS